LYLTSGTTQLGVEIYAVLLITVEVYSVWRCVDSLQNNLKKKIILKMEAAVSSETSVTRELSTRHHNPKDSDIGQVKSYEVQAG